MFSLSALPIAIVMLAAPKRTPRNNCTFAHARRIHIVIEITNTLQAKHQGLRKIGRRTETYLQNACQRWPRPSLSTCAHMKTTANEDLAGPPVPQLLLLLLRLLVLHKVEVADVWGLGCTLQLVADDTIGLRGRPPIQRKLARPHCPEARTAKACDARRLVGPNHITRMLGHTPLRSNGS